MTALALDLGGGLSRNLRKVHQCRDMHLYLEVNDILSEDLQLFWALYELLLPVFRMALQWPNPTVVTVHIVT